MLTRLYRCTIHLDGGSWKQLVQREYLCVDARAAAQEFAVDFRRSYSAHLTEEELIKKYIKVYVASTNELVERDLYV